MKYYLIYYHDQPKSLARSYNILSADEYHAENQMCFYSGYTPCDLVISVESSLDAAHEKRRMITQLNTVLPHENVEQ